MMIMTTMTATVTTTTRSDFLPAKGVCLRSIFSFWEETRCTFDKDTFCVFHFFFWEEKLVAPLIAAPNVDK